MGTYSITEPLVVAAGGANTKMITYIYGHALTKCDCGKDLMLTQAFYGDSLKSTCACGRKTELKNGKFKTSKK